MSRTSDPTTRTLLIELARDVQALRHASLLDDFERWDELWQLEGLYQHDRDIYLRELSEVESTLNLPSAKTHKLLVKFYSSRAMSNLLYQRNPILGMVRKTP